VVKIPAPGLIEVTKVKLHPANVKEHPEKQIKNLMKLIEWVGFKDPIVLDKDFNCKAGHGRLLAAEKLGMKEVPYVMLEGLTKKQMDLFMYMDNQINESPWIKENVQLLLQEIPMKELEFFDVDWERTHTPNYPEEKEEIPEPPANPKSKPGQMWQLGEHRLMCGDSTRDIEKLLGDKTVDLLVTDPPYGVDYSGKNEYLNKITKPNRIQTPIINDNIKSADYPTFFENFLKIIPFSSYNCFYIFMGDTELASLVQALSKLKFFITSYLVWNKNRMIFGRKDYHSKHEIILYGWKGRHKFYGPKNRTTVIDYGTRNVNDLHPTMKPLEILTQLITDGSKKEMLVFDPFLGSGSTLIAAEQTGRSCYGLELSPAYCDVIIERWENFTGQKAKLL
jgi:DNA modification methylase